MSWLNLSRFIARFGRKPQSRRASPRQQTRRLVLESLEDRFCPSGSYLFVSSLDTNSVLRYDENTGAFVDAFVPMNGAGLRQPTGLVFGPDHNLYVGSGLEADNGNGTGHRDVLRYNGTSGAFIDDFADSNQLQSPRAVLFGPDGNLYVADGFANAIVRYNGTTGAFIDDFVPPGSGGIRSPTAMVFGPDGSNDGKLDLYVGEVFDHTILRYDGTTGAFKGVFVASGSGGLNNVQGLVFGPDGNLYAESANVTNSGTFPPGSILRFEGPGGPNPGAFVDTFIAAGSGGLSTPFGGLLFGPDGKSDGKLDLYVTSVVASFGPANGKVQFVAAPGTSEVLRYDGTTGAFLSTFVTPDSGGLQFPTFMTFTETDPTTLNYNPGEKLTAAAIATKPTNASLRADRAQPLLAEALRRWEATGVDVSALHGIDVRIADLGGATLGLASGHTITLDDNAAGWGWFVDPTLHSDSEFTTPGNQGEQHHMDLLTVLEHELGHLLGHEHEETGVMIDTLPAGTRRAPSDGIDTATRLDGRDLYIAFFGANEESPWIGGSLFGRARHKR